MTDVYLAFRLLNIALAVVSLIGTSMSLRWIWPHVPTEPRLSRLSVAAFSFAALEGTVEGLAMDIPGGPRTFVWTVALLLATVTALLPRERRLIPPPTRRKNPPQETPS